MQEQFEIAPYLIWMFSGAMYLIGLASFYSWLRNEAQGLFVQRTRRYLLFGSGALLSGFLAAKLVLETTSIGFSHEMVAINLTVLVVTVVFVTVVDRYLEQAVFSIVVIGVIAWFFMPKIWLGTTAIAAVLLLLDWRFAVQIRTHWWLYYLSLFALALPVLVGTNCAQLVSGWVYFAQGLQVVILGAVARGYSWLIRSQVARTKRFAREAYFDQLTGLHNFRAFTEDLQKVFGQYCQDNSGFAIYTLDVDHFKRINDTYGHLYGNHVLKTVAACLVGALQDVGYKNVLYRTGGEEFSIVLRGVQDSASEAKRITRHLQQSIAALRFAAPASDLRVTVSIGEDRVLASDENYLDVYERADQYLYQSKRNGRNAITLRGETLTRE